MPGTAGRAGGLSAGRREAGQRPALPAVGPAFFSTLPALARAAQSWPDGQVPRIMPRTAFLLRAAAGSDRLAVRPPKIPQAEGKFMKSVHIPRQLGDGRLRVAACGAMLAALALPAFAAKNAVVNVSCKEAISQAELDAANRKWTPMRPDPTSPVLNITTSMNYTKAVLLGSVFSHPKTGELTFDNSEGPGICELHSNGHPADVVLKDLAKKFKNAPAPPPVAPAPPMSPAPAAKAEVPASRQTMNNGDVIGLVKAGLPAAVIVAKIQTSADAFDTSSAALELLKADGVPDAVILAMVKAPAASAK